MKIFFFYKLKNLDVLKKKINYIKKTSVICKNNVFSNKFFLFTPISKHLNITLKGLNNFVKNGKRMFILKNFNSYFKLFYFFIYNSEFNKIKNNNFLYFSEIKSIIKENLFLKNFINLLHWYMNYFNFIFYLKNVNNSNSQKIIKKNKNEKNSFKLSLVPKFKRNLYFFKWLKYFIFLENNSRFSLNLAKILNNVFLNFKSSNLYKYKIQMYKLLIK